MTEHDREAMFALLRRYPDVEAANLQAWDATDGLLLDALAGLPQPAQRVAVIGDRYGALTLGALAMDPALQVRVHQDLASGERALLNNAATLGLQERVEHHPLGPSLLDGADAVLLQLPKTLAELEETADAVARHAPQHAVLLGGGRVKHMTLGMNAVLERYFGTVQPQLARRKSRVLIASEPKAVREAPPYPVCDANTELGITVCAHGAVFAGNRLDIGTRFLLTFLPVMPAARHAVDLGCGTGILAAMYAGHYPEARVTATDQSAAAVASARATAEANGLGERIHVLRDDAMSTVPDGSADLILLNPPFHLGASVHAGAGLKMIEAAGRVLAPGGELWTVFNTHLAYTPALERLVGPTRIQGRNPKFTVSVSTRRQPFDGRADDVPDVSEN